MKGKFIVFYGINNLGKTTQAKLLIEKLQQQGIQVEFTKYAHYDLEPTGKLINDYLREGNPHNFSPREFQLLHFAERLQYEPILKKKLDQGITVVAEDYFPTAIAWGTGAGVDQDFLEYLYKFIRHEDLGFLFDGNRFTEAIESGHKHETDNPLVEKVREVHMDLAQKYGWLPINANDTIANIHEKIWDSVSQII